ncbi:hypothetical protein [Embleya hyalina]|uniref:Transposase n=1 Tax=Embleya hyalina TaxID=516124 RepID=A0A401Z1F1_9ACTN|nr:hypothetical protein [Embleya hyalina]GCE00695.1 transposase [Embleya hyalina]
MHADRGTSTTSRKVSQLPIDLGVARSHSRPRVSNDNPYSEANFRTIQYKGDFPGFFDSLAHAREWIEVFVASCTHTPGSATTRPLLEYSDVSVGRPGTAAG